MSRKTSIIAVFVIAISMIGALGATQLQAANKPGAMFFAGDPAVVANGIKIYSENCASCHGADLKGEAKWRSPNAEGFLPAPPHDKSGHTWHHIDDLLFQITKFGIAEVSGQKDYKTTMPIFDDLLSDDEIIAVLSYIKSTWPKNIQERHDQMNELRAKN